MMSVKIRAPTGIVSNFWSLWTRHRTPNASAPAEVTGFKAKKVFHNGTLLQWDEPAANAEGGWPTHAFKITFSITPECDSDESSDTSGLSAGVNEDAFLTNGSVTVLTCCEVFVGPLRDTTSYDFFISASLRPPSVAPSVIQGPESQKLIVIMREFRSPVVVNEDSDLNAATESARAYQEVHVESGNPYDLDRPLTFLTEGVAMYRAAGHERPIIDCSGVDRCFADATLTKLITIPSSLTALSSKGVSSG